ncbi:hypothetical protein GGD66_002489 [Bradyrhizobium sp. CIR48]|uniref:hypothetical protein n=1 Tax=Bradyrhizobium sp. CIR48 TaxID=2663840 RepID=UPI0016057376|nr:hypothetical protein [Bradyrhizobium sp. CIR48]MBB4423945.1 hypothetical protein [Bradyrhizobium sp. CIR48]
MMMQIAQGLAPPQQATADIQQRLPAWTERIEQWRRRPLPRGGMTTISEASDRPDRVNRITFHRYEFRLIGFLHARARHPSSVLRRSIGTLHCVAALIAHVMKFCPYELLAQCVRFWLDDEQSNKGDATTPSSP